MEPESIQLPEVPTQPPASPAPRAPRRAWGLALLALAAGLALGGGGVLLALRGAGAAGNAHPSEGAAEAKPLYQCPMHPTITADHPGDCPICGMKLVLVPPGGGAGERKIRFYRSPMDPKQTSPTPRKDEMGMDYLPVYEDEEAGKPAAGLATVTIDPARQQLIGLRTAAVTRGAVGATWRTVGRVQVDPRGVRKVNVKVEGYVEHAFVDFVGQPVRRGQPLFTLYSPSLLAAQNEYLLALRTQEALGKAGGTFAENGDALVRAARRKLELWDVPTSEIDRVASTGQASRTLTFYSPISGVVTVKSIVEGARLSPGDAPYEITDLDQVWVMADAYESDLAKVRVGMPATLTLHAYPGRTYAGEVAFLEPLLDPKTRTLRVHLHFMNHRGDLKPEMFGEVVLQGEEKQGLLIPSDAVVRSGEIDVVFLSLPGGKFQPREVRLGAKSGDMVEVERGLEEGEQVVIRANFLVDSESQLRASLAAIGGK